MRVALAGLLWGTINVAARGLQMIGVADASLALSGTLPSVAVANGDCAQDQTLRHAALLLSGRDEPARQSRDSETWRYVEGSGIQIVSPRGDARQIG